MDLPRKIKQLSVLGGDRPLGILSHGSMHSFQYTQNEVQVSLSMPAINDPYNSGSLHAIFRQNLPEGFNRQFIAGKLARFARVNDMYLLALQGCNGIGHLNYQSEWDLPKAESISLDEILKYSGSKPLFPQLLEKYYLRNLLSGVQPKVSVPTSRNTALQSDLIVKSYDREFDLLTVNEFVCMEAARACNLNPPPVYLADNLEHLVVERFDLDGANKLGFEDFTTILNKPDNPDARYNGSYETVLKAIYHFSGEMSQVELGYRLIVFNCLIGNGDAHLKNFALLYQPGKLKAWLSPPYDITHTIMYPTVDNKMALKIAGSKEFPDKKALMKLGISAGLSTVLVREIIEQTADSILAYVAKSNEVQQLPGLRASIEQSVAKGVGTDYTVKSYRHDRKLKFP